MQTSSLDRAKQWASNAYFAEADRQEIQDLIDQEDHNEIEERFYKDLEFGTGGMRSVLGQGNNRINKYNIRKATHAVALEIKNTGEDNLRAAISYDSRRFSFEFAKEAASVFAANGIKAFIYKRLNPVSLVSFAIRHHKCQAGVMVTASHNPPDYNGFKVFWSDGAQVTPPNDSNIINHFNDIQDYSLIPHLDFEEGIKKGLIEWMGEETESLYYNTIKEKCLTPELCQERGRELNIIYTALHGTGLHCCTRALEQIGLTNIKTVPEQDRPDGNFPTVSSPNPENPEALSMAVALMKKEKGDLALGTDPDTDRVGVALQHEGQTHYLNGNQIGLLMLHYILVQLKEKNAIPSDPYFVKTIVTTELQTIVANAFGVATENTLTGFKWICGRMKEIEETHPEKNFIFGTEESFGYLNHDSVRDKDGVASIALLCELALYHKSRGFNLLQALDQIYEQYGFSSEELLSLNYYGKEGAEKISRIMDKFRHFEAQTLCGQEIASLADYQAQSIRHQNGDTTKLELPQSNVLGFTFASGNKLFLRPSGTEPKIKFYIMIQETEGSLQEKKAKASQLTAEFLTFLKAQAEEA